MPNSTPTAVTIMLSCFYDVKLIFCLQIFSGNYDAITPVENKFNRLIETQYVELRPREWHRGIAMRIEIKGCFQPYRKLCRSCYITYLI